MHTCRKAPYRHCTHVEKLRIDIAHSYRKVLRKPFCTLLFFSLGTNYVGLYLIIIHDDRFLNPSPLIFLLTPWHTVYTVYIFWFKMYFLPFAWQAVIYSKPSSRFLRSFKILRFFAVNFEVWRNWFERLHFVIFLRHTWSCLSIPI